MCPSACVQMHGLMSRVYAQLAYAHCGNHWENNHWHKSPDQPGTRRDLGKVIGAQQDPHYEARNAVDRLKDLLFECARIWQPDWSLNSQSRNSLRAGVLFRSIYMRYSCVTWLGSRMGKMPNQKSCASCAAFWLDRDIRSEIALKFNLVVFRIRSGRPL